MKKLIAIALIVVLIFSLSACSDNNGGISVDSNGTITVKIGASSVPHAEILEFAKTQLQQEYGIVLDIIVFDDYITPNTSLSSGDIYANYFQHIPYMNSYNANSGQSQIVDIVGVHLEPLGIYKGGRATASTLEEIANQSGDKTVVFTNDATNQARALALLESNGIITKKVGVSQVVDYNDYQWGDYIPTAIDPETLVAVGLPDCHIAVIPGNFALTGGVSGALVTENPQDATIADNYVNVVAVRVGSSNTAVSKALVNVLSSQSVAQFITTKYQDAVIPAFGN